jgi:hypothetical protein
VSFNGNSARKICVQIAGNFYLVQLLHDRLLPGGGMGADGVTEALERNLAEVLELEAFAEA